MSDIRPIRQIVLTSTAGDAMTAPRVHHPEDVRADWELFEEFAHGERSHYHRALV